MKKLGIFIKESQTSLRIKDEVIKCATSRGYTLDDENPDVVIFIGGDGTFLKCVHKYINQLNEIEFIGINNGKVGFFFEYREEDIETIFDLLDSNNYKISEYPLLKAKYGSSTVYAINEIRVENPFRTLIGEVYISGTYLENFRGNGLVIASAIGSSAYNKSLGGALVHPSLKIMQLTEVAAIENNMYHSLGSSIILDKNETVTIKANMEGVVIGYDNFTDVNKEDYIEIRIANRKARVIHANSYSYFAKLNKTFIK